MIYFIKSLILFTLSLFINYDIVHNILIRFLTAHIGITGDYILALV